MSFFAKFILDSNLLNAINKQNLEYWKDGIQLNISVPSSDLEKIICDLLNIGCAKDSAIKTLVVKSVDGKVVFTLDTLKAIIDRISRCSRSFQLYQLYLSGIIDEPQTDLEGTKDFPFVFTLSTPLKCSSFSSSEKI